MIPLDKEVDFPRNHGGSISFLSLITMEFGSRLEKSSQGLNSAMNSSDRTETGQIDGLRAGEGAAGTLPLPADATPTPTPTPALDQGTLPLPPHLSGSTLLGVQGPSLPGYELLEEIGRGGMGVVYRARQVRLNRIVALKMILPGSGLDGSQHGHRFRAEGEALAAVVHPHVVQVYEVGEAAGHPYMTLEYLEGGTLKAYLTAKGSLPPAEGVELMRQMAAGVAAAHLAGIVHRDLKPANVLFTDAPDSGKPLHLKVTDFGLAKRQAGNDLTGSHAILGTPSYMAPEQARGDSKFARPDVDVWALGVILFQMLTGRLPFEADDPWVLMQRIISDDVPSLHSLRSGVPRDLDLITRKCLAKDPNDRYPTAKELVDDLTAYHEGRPVTARRSGEWERAWKWLRRNRGVALSFSVAIGALIVGATASIIFGLRAQAEAAQAEKDRIAAGLAQKQAEANLREAVTTTRSFVTLADQLREALGNPTALLARTVDQTNTNLARLRNAGDSPEVREQQVALKTLVADLRLTQERTDLALSVNGEAIAELEALRAEGRATAEVETGLWYAYATRARTHLRQGQTTPALADLLKAEEAARRLAAIPGQQIPGDDRRARTLNLLMQTHWMAGNFPDGDRCAAEELILREKLLSVSPPEDRGANQRRLAQSYTNRGAILYRTEKPGAEAEYRKARDLLEAIAGESQSAQYDLVDALVNLAFYPQMQGDATTANALLDEAGRIVDSLVRADPENGERQRQFMYQRLVRSQSLPPGADPTPFIRDRVTLAESMITRSLRYVEADPANFTWRNRLGMSRTTWARAKVSLPTSGGFGTRMASLIACQLALADAEELAYMRPDNWTACQNVRSAAEALAQIEQTTRRRVSPTTVTAMTAPLIAYCDHRLTLDPSRDDLRLDRGKSRFAHANLWLAVKLPIEELVPDLRRAVQELEPLPSTLEIDILRVNLLVHLGTGLWNLPDDRSGPPASVVVRQALTLLDRHGFATSTDPKQVDRWIEVASHVLFSMRFEDRPKDEALAARARGIRLTRLERRVADQEYLKNKALTVPQAELRNQVMPEQRRLQATIVAGIETYFVRERSEDRAIELAEHLLIAAEYADPAAPDHREQVAGFLERIIQVYEILGKARKTPPSPEEERLIATVKGELRRWRKAPLEQAPPPRLVKPR